MTGPGVAYFLWYATYNLITEYMLVVAGNTSCGGGILLGTSSIPCSVLGKCHLLLVVL